MSGELGKFKMDATSASSSEKKYVPPHRRKGLASNRGVESYVSRSPVECTSLLPSFHRPIETTDRTVISMDEGQRHRIGDKEYLDTFYKSITKEFSQTVKGPDVQRVLVNLDSISIALKKDRSAWTKFSEFEKKQIEHIDLALKECENYLSKYKADSQAEKEFIQRAVASIQRRNDDYRK